MSDSGKKPSAIKVTRSRKTTKLPPMFLGSFPKLLTPDEYEGKSKFKARFHANPRALEALGTLLQAKCIDQHFADMKKEVDEEVAEAKAAKKTPAVTICEDASGAMSPAEWLEMQLKEPNEKDKVQLPFLTLGVNAFLPAKKGEEPETRTIKFWDLKGALICDSSEPTKAIKTMSAGSVVQPVVHCNLFLSKVNGKAPRPQLQLVGLVVIKIETFARGQTESPGGVDEEEVKRIMGDDYDGADDLAASMKESAEADMDDDQDNPF